MKKASRTLRIFFFILLPSAFILVLSGCSALGVAAYKIAGAPSVEAKYTPAKTPILVLVENYRHPSSASADGDLLARYVADDLSASDVAPIVAEEKLSALRDARGPGFLKMSISAIGKEVGAAQVIYVQLVRDDVTPLQGGEALQGQAQVRVKIVDTASGNTLWPTDVADGYELAASTALGTESGRSVRDVRQRVYQSLAVQIGRLFHKWTPEDSRPESISG